MIMTTHDLALAAQADRLLLLGFDGFVADGPPAEVLRDEVAWARLGLVVPEWVQNLAFCPRQTGQNPPTGSARW